MSEPVPAYQVNHYGQWCFLNLFSILVLFVKKNKEKRVETALQ